MSIETNCFRIFGLDALGATYRLYEIAGLRRDGPDYFGNVQRLVRRLSFQMKAPVTTYDAEGTTFLVVPTEFGDPPDHITLVGVVATLKDTGDDIDLEFTAARPDLDPVRLRFLQFIFQGWLWKKSRLWQPRAGKPFFFKEPIQRFSVINLYEGFAMRAVRHPEGGFGLVVDLRRKLVSRSSLPVSSTREQINMLRGRSCVYKMGYYWFEISLAGLSDMRVGDPTIPFEGKPVSLIGYLHKKSPKPVPASIANLSPDGVSIYYRTNGPQQRSAPAELCYLVEDTHSQGGSRYQAHTAIRPQYRRNRLRRLVQKYLRRVPVGNIDLSVSNRLGCSRQRPFFLPNLRFGSGVTLSFEGSKHNARNSIKDYGRKRLSLLTDKKAGFFEQSRLDRQYLVWPKSVANSYGPHFLDDLKKQADRLYSNGRGYNPEVIVYDDLHVRHDFVGQSRAINKAVRAADVKTGYALVMVHRYNRRPRSADQLAAWIVKEFPLLFELNTAVIHTDMPKTAYASVTRRNKTHYVVKRAQRMRFSGYLRNVALNKILLTNGKWPYILDTALYSDIVIGIDVKNNTAAFTLFADGGKIVRFATSPSRQKEQLLKGQVEKFVFELICQEANYLKRRPKQIVVHRDGRAWTAETEGIKSACRQLAEQGHIDPEWQLTVVEIAKSAPAPVRLFDVTPPRRKMKCHVSNPTVGNWIQTGPNDGYVCTTGNPFPIPGTANPLHIRRADGEMPIAECLSDVFWLSCLTWTRPEGAMRLPISIKLCDRSLFDEAAEYDRDAIEFANSELRGQVVT